MTKPVRVQLSRKKGWRMPPNTVKVTRPGPYGNPFAVGKAAPECYARFHRGPVNTATEAVILFRRVLLHELSRQTPAANAAIGLVAALRGKNLACFCALDQPCHADVLIELANAAESAPTRDRTGER